MTTNRVEIDVPPHDVFVVLMDAFKYGDWVVGAKRVRAVDPMAGGRCSLPPHCRATGGGPR